MSDWPFLPSQKGHSQPGRGIKRKCPGHDGKRCLNNSEVASNEHLCQPCSNRAKLQRYAEAAAAAEEEQEDEPIPPPRQDPPRPLPRAPLTAPRAPSMQYTDFDGNERCHGFLGDGNQCSNSFKRDPRAARHVCPSCANRGVDDVQCEKILPGYHNNRKIRCTRRAAPTFTWAPATCPQCKERNKREWKLITCGAGTGQTAELKRKRDAEERVKERMREGPHRPPSGKTRKIDDFSDEEEEEGPVEPRQPRSAQPSASVDRFDDGNNPYRPSKRSKRVESKTTALEDWGIRNAPQSASNAQPSQGAGNQLGQGVQSQGGRSSTAVVQHGTNHFRRVNEADPSIWKNLPLELARQILKDVIVNRIRNKRTKGRNGRHKLWEQITDFDNQHERIYHLDSMYRYPNNDVGPRLKTIAHQTPTRMYINSKLYYSLRHIMGPVGFFDLMSYSWSRIPAIRAWKEIVEGCNPRTVIGVRRKEGCLDVFRELDRVWPLGDGTPKEGQTLEERRNERLLENRHKFCPEGETAVNKWKNEGKKGPRPGPCPTCRPAVTGLNP